MEPDRISHTAAPTHSCLSPGLPRARDEQEPSRGQGSQGFSIDDVDDLPWQAVSAPSTSKRVAFADSPWVTASTSMNSSSSPRTCSTATSLLSSRTLFDCESPSTPCSVSSQDQVGHRVRKLSSSYPPTPSDLGQPLLKCASDNAHKVVIFADAARVYWEAAFVVLPMFCGYASLFGLQHHLKRSLGIRDDGSDASFIFSFAVTAVYVGNLTARFGHSFVFCCISPRQRVFWAMGAMLCSMLIIAVFIIILKVHSLSLVVLAYCLGGLAIGTFESNILGCLTPLGHRTKHIAIVAIPGGVAGVMIGGFCIMGPPFDVSPHTVYLCVAAFIATGILIMSFCIPNLSLHMMEPTSKLQQFRDDLRHWRQWLPRVWHYALASTVDMFTLAGFAPGLLLYVYNERTVELLSGWHVETDIFFAVVNLGNLLGGVVGRSISYRLTPRHPLLYCLINLTGILMLLSFTPLLAPLGTFLVLLGDGLIYGTISKHIDSTFPTEFNLVAISMWLFIGDFGACLGSCSTNFLRTLIVG